MKKILGLVLGLFIIFSCINLGLISAASQRIDVGVNILEDEKNISIEQKRIGRFEIEGAEETLASLGGGNLLIVLISVAGLIFFIILVILIFGKIVKKRNKKNSKDKKKKSKS
tara:strand:+ start:476 stop:814 length:339 start_codon:yes stop_codon:yes gene_type:complete